MFNLENAIRKWKKGLFRNESLNDGIIEELESHLRDDIKHALDQGASEKDAFRKAVSDLGSAERIGAECFKTDTRGLSGRPPWTYSRLSPGLWINYAKLSFRKLRKQKGYSLINLAGLAIGMACCILILLWVNDELSYDRFHPNAGRLCRVIGEDHRGGEVAKYLDTPSLLGPTLLEDYPEVINYCRMQCGWKNYWLHYEDKNFMEERLCTADPTFFEMFQFPFIHGDPKTALKERYSVVLTESLARKCFGDENPMGKVMKLSDQDMTVTGVIQDIPSNSHIQFDYCFPAINMTRFRSSELDTWKYMQFATYLELREGVELPEFSKKIRHIVKDHLAGSKIEIDLQPFKKIHLFTKNVETWTVRYPSPGNITYVYIFAAVAFCILLIACINFMNLATARSSQRAREVGMRKVAGANRADLIRQFFGESLAMSFFALAAALLLVEGFLPTFNRLAGKSISLTQVNLPLLLGLIGVAVITGFLAGSYPALFLSAFQPTAVLKDLARSGARRSGSLRKILVVFQFALTTILLVVTTVIYSQLHYIQTKDLGFDQENIISFASYGRFGENYEAAKQELMQNPNILHVCKAFPPSQGFRRTTDVDWEGKDPSSEIVFGSDIGDYDFLDTFGMEMAEGRYYSREFSTDGDNFVINETAARLMGPGSPLGKRFRLRDKTGTIIGVVRDYHGGSLHEPITPKVIEMSGGFHINVKFQGPIPEMLGYLEGKWKDFVGAYPFRYEFLDESIGSFYQSERKISAILRNFTILAVFIACLGLLGLAAFTSEQRTKEIGIRKVLGARVAGLIAMLAKDFAKWVLAANLIAWPLAYYLGYNWLCSFSYRIRLGWEIFILTLAAALTVSLLTVGFQAIKAAAADPVKSLRYE